jgi:hypothetical protein
MRGSIALAVMSMSGLALAQDAPPLACDPREPRDVCELKIQRNNAMDQVAIEKRKIELMIGSEKALVEYWNGWAIGDVAKADWWDRLWSSLKQPMAKR